MRNVDFQEADSFSRRKSLGIPVLRIQRGQFLGFRDRKHELKGDRFHVSSVTDLLTDILADCEFQGACGSFVDGAGTLRNWKFQWPGEKFDS
jgi:hypothetical protein